MGLADDVGGDDVVLVVTEGLGDGGSVGLHSGVDLVDGDLLVNDSVEVGDGAGRRRDALGGTDELTVELGENQADSLGSTGGVGDDVDGAGAATTLVALALRAVERHLVAGPGVNGGHDAGHDGSEVVQTLGHRGEAVGGAGSSGDDVVLSGQRLVVDVVHDGGQIAAGRSGDDDLLGASVDVGLSLSLAGVEAGALENDVDVEVAPRQVVGVGLLVDLDLLAVNGDGILASNDLVIASVVALRGVVLQQVSEHIGRGEVVDSDDLGALMTEHLTESQTTDATEAVNSNLYCHCVSFRKAPASYSARR